MFTVRYSNFLTPFALVYLGIVNEFVRCCNNWAAEL
jgi:hypothetical protein